MRYYGAYANRVRRLYRVAKGEERGSGGRGFAQDLRDPQGRDDESEFTRKRSKTWARLLRKVFEVEPLLCPQCTPDYPSPS